MAKKSSIAKSIEKEIATLQQRAQAAMLEKRGHAELDAEVDRRRARAELPELEEAVDEVPAVPAVEMIARARLCEDCGAEFSGSALRMEGRELFAQRKCEACVQRGIAARDADAAAERRRDREIEWEDICPEDYRDTDLSRLEADWAAAGVAPKLRGTDGSMVPVTMAEILAQPPEAGLALVGPTGRGKTRLMFALLHRYHHEGLRVLYVNGATFADKLAAQYGESPGAAERWMMRHIRVPVLFYDDLGKEATSGPARKMSERAEEALYRLVEERKAGRRALFFTSNKTRKELLARMSEDRGAPIVRRLLDLCRSVAL